MGVFIHTVLPLGGPERLGRVGSRSVVVDEGCDRAVGSAFADLLFGGRPQDGRVIRGFGGGERRGRCEAKHGGRKNRAESAPIMGLVPMSLTSLSVWGSWLGLAVRRLQIHITYHVLVFCERTSFRVEKIPADARGTRGDGDQNFRPPSSMPRKKNFWLKAKTRTTGIIATTAPASTS